LKKQFACLVQGFPLGPGWLLWLLAGLAAAAGRSGGERAEAPWAALRE